MKTYRVFIASFGGRPQFLCPLVMDLRRLTPSGFNLQITVIADKYRDYLNQFMAKYDIDVVIIPENKIYFADHPRKWVRNANIHLLDMALGCENTPVLCLNDDMRIISPGFIQGFEMATAFGVCIPTNPRVYVKYNAQGADTDNTVMPEKFNVPLYLPAVNFSPLFYYDIIGALEYLHDVKLNMTEGTIVRGTLALSYLAYQTEFTPLILPEQWCVCASNAQYIKNYKKTIKGEHVSIEPIMLHVGHKEVRAVFADELKHITDKYLSEGL